jgi:hypothetical protein
VFDEDDDTVSYYLDGQFLQKRKWGKPVKEMDCAPANVTVGHRYPGNTYQMDVRTPTGMSPASDALRVNVMATRTFTLLLQLLLQRHGYGIRVSFFI